MKMDTLPATQPDPILEDLVGELEVCEDAATRLRGEAIQAVLLRPRTVDLLSPPPTAKKTGSEPVPTPARSNSHGPQLESEAATHMPSSLHQEAPNSSREPQILTQIPNQEAQKSSQEPQIPAAPSTQEVLKSTHVPQHSPAVPSTKKP